MKNITFDPKLIGNKLTVCVNIGGKEVVFTANLHSNDKNYYIDSLLAQKEGFEQVKDENNNYTEVVNLNILGYNKPEYAIVYEVIIIDTNQHHQRIKCIGFKNLNKNYGAQILIT